MPNPNDNHDENLRFLEEMIGAARADEPTDEQWQHARSRLDGMLQTELPAKPEGVVGRLVHLLARRFAAISFSAAVLICAIVVPLLLSTTSPVSVHADCVSSGGSLVVYGPNGVEVARCPLQHTAVEANVAGFVSRTIVRQKFANTLGRRIEAVYVFPLPQDAAVDSMTMVIGDRRVTGRVKQREEARRVYEQAKAAGKLAGLLDQERPNIFTQSVANIPTDAVVEVEISYVETLKYKDGWFEFVFPMVVAPRYNPGTAAPDAATSAPAVTASATGVPDGARINPPVQQPEKRAGHDIDIEVFLNAGSEVRDIESTLHEVTIDRSNPQEPIVALKNRKEIPNRDFVLRYRTASDKIEDALLTSTGPFGEFFALVMQPPLTVTPADARPKELIFVIDRSGSMQGFPIEKAKETMRLCMEKMNPMDTFNLLSFSGGLGKCFETPVPGTPDNVKKAQDYLADLTGSGGTEMMPAIMEALARPPDPQRVRIVCFMTDGEIGNDFEIIDAVKRNVQTSRVFAFGIGNSVNRFLLDAMAREGCGEVEYVTLNSDAGAAAQRFAERISNPVLTDISIDWGILPVTEVYPKHIPDLFSHEPIMVHGKLTSRADGEAVLRGNTAQGPFERRIRVSSAAASKQRDALDSLWARAKVDYLMHQDLKAVQAGTFPDELKKEIVDLGVKFGIMSQFTSFVAVDEETTPTSGTLKRVRVPAENPDGQTSTAEMVWDCYDGGDQPLFVDSTYQLFSGDGNSAQYGAYHNYSMPSPTQGQNAQWGGQAGRAAVAQDLNYDGLLDVVVANGNVNGNGIVSGTADGPAATMHGAQNGPTLKAVWKMNGKPLGKTVTKFHVSDDDVDLDGDVDIFFANGGTTTGIHTVRDYAYRLRAPLSKLSGRLQGLKECVERLGREGTYADGSVTVTQWLVKVVIHTSAPEDQEKLKPYDAESSTGQVLMRPMIAEPNDARGMVRLVDVRRLPEIAALPCVRKVELHREGSGTFAVRGSQ